MTLARIARRARPCRALLATASAMAVIPLAAKAETVANVDISLGAMAASNPYLRDGTDTESGAATLTIRPYISVADDETTATLEGALDLERFFDYYGTDGTVQVGASINHRINERTTFSSDVGFRSSDSAARHFYGGPNLDGLEPGEFPDSEVIDPTLGNVSGRSTRLDVGFSLSQLVSANGVLDFSAGLGLTRVESGNGADYRDTETTLSYSRELDARTSLLANVKVGYADYFNRQAGDGVFVTMLAGVKRKFTESAYGSMEVGISYAAVETLLDGQENVTNWSATLNLCDSFAGGALCASGSRAAQPTALGGITMVSSIGVSYSRLIGKAGSLSVAANYSKTGTPESSPFLLGRRESKVANVSGSYRHQVADRLAAYITPSFTSNDDVVRGKEENYQVLVGLSYLFGKMQ